MKIQLLGLLLVCANAISLHANYWTQKADFGGIPRADGIGFSIGNKGYMGTGYTGTYSTDWWEYDPATNTWTQKANFGGSGIVESVSFTIGSMGV
jgi:N-acetylneuraminic acid mutarotase